MCGVSYKIELIDKISNAILKPTMAYGIELRGLTKPSTTTDYKLFSSKSLRKMSRSPLYVPNIVHQNLTVPTTIKNFQSELAGHPNPLAQSHIIITEPPTSLELEWPQDLLLIDLL